MSRAVKNRLKAQYPDRFIQFESPFKNFRLLLQSAPDGTRLQEIPPISYYTSRRYK